MTRTIKFTDSTTTYTFHMEGTAVEVPIYVKEPLVDMMCCVQGKLYRKNVVVKNRGKISYKMMVRVPPELEGNKDSGGSGILSLVILPLVYTTHAADIP